MEMGALALGSGRWLGERGGRHLAHRAGGRSRTERLWLADGRRIMYASAALIIIFGAEQPQQVLEREDHDAHQLDHLRLVQALLDAHLVALAPPSTAVIASCSVLASRL